jgi:hypothetical protein
MSKFLDGLKQELLDMFLPVAMMVIGFVGMALLGFGWVANANILLKQVMILKNPDAFIVFAWLCFSSIIFPLGIMNGWCLWLGIF